MKRRVRALERGPADDDANEGKDGGDDDAANEAKPAAAGLAFGGRALVRRNKKKQNDLLARILYVKWYQLQYVY